MCGRVEHRDAANTGLLSYGDDDMAHDVDVKNDLQRLIANKHDFNRWGVASHEKRMAFETAISDYVIDIGTPIIWR